MSICLGIVGSSSWKKKDILDNINIWLKTHEKPSIVVSGGTDNIVDISVKDFALKYKYPLEEINPDFLTYGKNAKYIQNKNISTLCTHLLIFLENNNTMDELINMCIKKGKNVTTKKLTENTV